MLPDLPVDVARLIADILFDPLSPKALLAYAACSKSIRSALQASDNLFIGLEKVKIWCTNATDLVRRSECGLHRPTSMSFMTANSFDADDFDLMCYMARHGSLNELRKFYVFSPGTVTGRPPNVVIQNFTPPWHELLRLLPGLKHLKLDMCNWPFDLSALIDALSFKVVRDEREFWSSSLVSFSLEDNHWFRGAVRQTMLDAIKEGRFPNLKSFTSDSGRWNGTHWQRGR